MSGITTIQAAWRKITKTIDQTIAATHDERAVDNHAKFKPHIKLHEIDDEFILSFADASNLHGPGSRRSTAKSALSSGEATPALTPESSAASSRTSSIVASETRRPSFGTRLGNLLRLSALPETTTLDEYHRQFEDPSMEEDQEEIEAAEFDKAKQHELKAWQQEAAGVDRAVRILPGVKKMIQSIPSGKYAVAISGAKTYTYGCMTRVGITPPPVTITADDKRLKAGNALTFGSSAASSRTSSIINKSSPITSYKVYIVLTATLVLAGTLLGQKTLQGRQTQCTDIFVSCVPIPGATPCCFGLSCIRGPNEPLGECMPTPGVCGAHGAQCSILLPISCCTGLNCTAAGICNVF
ncbi:hypothetical protein K435DRAFT_780259 [Dendrothele bispora CBS 962.96]|uniref:Uncharacterized protein n=1 Tax=Dendrothele bispora (strain CBS 962.96) TaxID=1314807 RepID=A0A4S8LTR1_DENBC|nr:hypothetical protein K435DRAFT_780259 [Dendrothele bispora CBS 962.96]